MTLEMSLRKLKVEDFTETAGMIEVKKHWGCRNRKTVKVEGKQAAKVYTLMTIYNRSICATAVSLVYIQVAISA